MRETANWFWLQFGYEGKPGLLISGSAGLSWRVITRATVAHEMSGSNCPMGCFHNSHYDTQPQAQAVHHYCSA